MEGTPLAKIEFTLQPNGGRYYCMQSQAAGVLDRAEDAFRELVKTEAWQKFRDAVFDTEETEA